MFLHMLECVKKLDDYGLYFWDFNSSLNISEANGKKTKITAQTE